MTDILKVDLFCLFTISIAITDIEIGCKILALSASTIYTLYKFAVDYKKNNNNNK